MKERLVSGQREGAWRLAWLPTLPGQDSGQVRRPAGLQAQLGHVITQTVEGDEQEVGLADHLVHVQHSPWSSHVRTPAMMNGPAPIRKGSQRQ